MPEIVLGEDVPSLRVILQSGVMQRFALSVQVEPTELVGIEAQLAFGEIQHVADLSETTYTWTFTATDVSELINQGSALLSLVGSNSITLLGRGIVEIRS